MSNQPSIFELEFCISEDQVARFLDTVGDTNPIHFDGEYCSNTRFRKPIVPGMLIGSIFSNLISAKFPGPGTIYKAQSLEFLAPIYINENLTARIEVTDLKIAEGSVVLNTVVEVEGKVAVAGVAEVLMAKNFLKPKRKNQPKLQTD